MTSRRDKVRLMLDAAEECGWEVNRTRNNHYRMTHPVTGATVFASSTPSEYRGIKNVIAELRRRSRV